MHRRWVAAAGLGAGVGLCAYAVYRSGGRRWRADEEEMRAAGMALPADLRHHFIRTDDGGRLHVVERGEGPPILLVHGVALSAAAWVHQLRELSEGHRVIALDVRGHGQSLAGGDGYDIDRLAADVLAVLQALEVRHGVLVGHSMGGMIALRLACRHPVELARHVGALGLVATEAGPVLTGPGHAWRAERVATLARRGLHRSRRFGLPGRPRGDVATWAARVAFGRRPRRVHVELTRSLITAMSPDPLAELIATIVAFDVRREVAAIRLPTMVMVGSLDLLTPLQAARLLQRSIGGSALERMPGAGHMLMLERRHEVNRLLVALAETGVPART